MFTPGVGTSTSTVISGGGRWTGRPCAFPPPNSSMPTPMSSRSHSALGVHGPGHRSASALGTHQPGPSAVHITRHSVRTSRPGRSTSDSGSGGSGESGGRSEGSTSTIRQADARPQRTVRRELDSCTTQLTKQTLDRSRRWGRGFADASTATSALRGASTFRLFGVELTSGMRHSVRYRVVVGS